MKAGGSLRTADYLDHMIQAIESVFTYVSGMDREAFGADRKTQDAVIRNLEIVGEACSNVLRRDPVFAQSHPEVPWRFAYEMRNVLAHGYFVVDLDVVWAPVSSDLPEMMVNVRALRQAFGEQRRRTNLFAPIHR